MPNPERPPLTRAVVLRGIGLAVAIALGALAVWLSVTSETPQSIRIGMLVGLWGLLLGAYSMFGARRGMGIDATGDAGREIALHESRALERVDDADARRDWESRLERLITREISTAVSRETAALRHEIAHLRQELVDKVGGQLRLERIETTRVIGSDLEALHHEVRQLKDANAGQSVRELLVGSSDSRVAVRPIVAPARVRPVSRPTAEVEADVQPAIRAVTSAAESSEPAQSAAEPTRPAYPAAAAAVSPAVPPLQVMPSARPGDANAGPQRPAATTQKPPAAAPRAAQPPAAQPPAAQAPAATPRPPAAPPVQPIATDPADAFASLPRLSRFTDFEPEVARSAANGHSGNGSNGNGHGGNGSRGNGHSGPNGGAAANGASAAPEAADYAGRRRRGDAPTDPPDRSASNGATPADPPTGGRRRREADTDDGSELLTRLLARETSER